MLSRKSGIHLGITSRAQGRASFVTSRARRAAQPNAPLDLDPSMKALLRDANMSLLNHRTKHHATNVSKVSYRELETLPSEAEEMEEFILEPDERVGRKSPAARFGSQQVGAVVLPEELQESIDSVIEDSDKSQLHNDAKRLFQSEDGPTGSWNHQYDVQYKSRRKAHELGERDGTAFATVALPAHYAAIFAVLNHAKQRLGPSWQVDTVYDWGAGTGSAFWAASSVFQNDAAVTNDFATMADRRIAGTTLTNYVAIERRQGLVAMGQRLLRNVKLDGISTSWNKGFSDEHNLTDGQGQGAVAISAFHLSEAKGDIERKDLVKQMWNSGAETIVLIDHGTKTGFSHVIEAREYLLTLGSREAIEGSAVPGAHVLAPCPHDGACPLAYDEASMRLVCSFNQRLQRPAFVRKTKHSGVGHEDVGYSYVVVRRGARPERATTRVGRQGELGRRDLEDQLVRGPYELKLHDESTPEDTSRSTPTEIVSGEQFKLGPEMRETLRQEAYDWPRLVFPPLKRSGHIILDVCASEGKIMRLTIPKSQGKQAYYDARKSEWGDIFPHESKNRPQIRYQPTRAKRAGGTDATRGHDIGKRAGGKDKKDPKASYTRIAKDIRTEEKSMQKVQRRVARKAAAVEAAERENIAW